VTFHALAALFSVFMLVRHGPRAVRLARTPEHRGTAAMSGVIVVLALAILAYAVKELASGLISR
jgi:cytochrome c biogenesis factor